MWRSLISSHLKTLASSSSAIVKPSLLSPLQRPSFLPSSSILSRYFATFSENVAVKKHEELQAELEERKVGHEWVSAYGYGASSFAFFNGSSRVGASHRVAVSAFFPKRSFSTAANPVESASDDSTAPEIDVPTRIKFKRLDKTARHIMQILDKEAVEDVRAQREIPDIKPGYIIQLKLEVPENKRRITTVKGIVIARRNAGLNTTFRIRRLVAGVGVESLLPLYSPNIKEIKVLDKKKVRRAKLYYLREKMNALKR